MKSLDEMIAVMEASKTKEIEVANLGQNDWSLCRLPPCWNWTHCDYRVKAQEPRRVWVNTYSDGVMSVWSDKLGSEISVNASNFRDRSEFIELTHDVKSRLGLT